MFAHISVIVFRWGPRGKAADRRRAKQLRARQTVEAVLDAVARILKRGGVKAVTTNRIAEVAGVSIGSVYQYFPDKRAIFVALHQRHIEEIDRLVETKLVENANSSLEELMRAMIEAMIDAHTPDLVLYELMFTEVPHRAEGTRISQCACTAHFVLRSRRVRMNSGRGGISTRSCLSSHMVESLSHGTVLRRPPGLSLADAKEESVRAVLTYLKA